MWGGGGGEIMTIGVSHSTLVISNINEVVSLLAISLA